MSNRTALAGGILLALVLCAGLGVWLGAGRGRAGSMEAQQDDRAASPSEPQALDPIAVERAEVDGRTTIPSDGAVVEDTPSAPVSGIRVRVIDGAGAPVPGARVRSFEDDEELLQLTDDEGTCTVPADSKGPHLRIHIDKEGFEHRDIGTGRARELEFQLRRTVSLEGHVLDARSGHPVPGARVAVATHDCGFCEISATAADPRGRFELEGVPLAAESPRSPWSQGSHVRAEAFGYLPTTRSFELSERDQRLELLLEPAAEVTLHVFDHMSGLPIAGARLKARGLELITGADGRVRAGALVAEDPATVTILGVSADGHSDLRATVTVQHVESSGEIRLPLVSLSRLRVRVVTPDDEPLEGIHVRTSFPKVMDELARGIGLPPGWRYSGTSAAASTESDGWCDVKHQPPGRTVELSAYHQGYRTVKCAVAIPPLPTVAEVVLQLERRPEVPEHERQKGAIRGRVSSSVPAEHLTVLWQGVTLEGKRRVEPDGTFELRRVQAGTVRLRAVPSGLDLDRCRDLVPEPLEVELPADGELEVDLACAVPLATIRGRVVQPDGRPATDHDLYASAAGACIPSSDRTGADGSFELLVQTDVGSYALVVPQGPLASSTGRRLEGIQPGADGIEIILAETGRLRWKATRPVTESSFPKSTLCWRKAGEAGYWDETPLPRADGWQEIELPVGSYDLTCRIPRDTTYLASSLEGYQLGPGLNEVEFDMVRGHEVTLRLAPDLSPWPDDEVLVLLLDDLRHDDVSSSRPGSLQTGPSFSSVGSARFMVRPDGSTSFTLTGLAPGRHRFRAFPDTIAIEPAEVVIGPDTPEVEVRWSYR